MKRSILLSGACSLVALTGMISCGQTKRGEYVDGSATILCDEGFKNILDEEIEVFEYTYPKSSIIPFYVSEVEAIDTLLADKADAIIVTTELTPDQIKYMKAKHKRVVRQKCIAVDAVALITNKNNPVGQLSMTEVEEIMTGKISRWDQLAGNDTTHIKLVFDNAGSSTVSYFREKFLGGNGSIADHTNSSAVKNNAQVFDYVTKDPNAIGIISVSWLGDEIGESRKLPLGDRMKDYKTEGDTIATVLTDAVNIIKISNPNEKNDFSNIGYKPYQAYIASGEYPLYRKVYMISTASNHSVMHSFYSFVTGTVGQKIIIRTGILPFQMQPRVVNLIDNSKK